MQNIELKLAEEQTKVTVVTEILEEEMTVSKEESELLLAADNITGVTGDIVIQTTNNPSPNPSTIKQALQTMTNFGSKTTKQQEEMRSTQNIIEKP